MRTPLCDEFGIEYPIFAFTPSEHVAAAVSRAGGLGVLGCVRFNEPEELEKTLSWLDENTDGKPYGVDIVMPMKIPTEGKSVDLKAMIPQDHIDFVDRTLQKLGVPPLPNLDRWFEALQQRPAYREWAMVPFGRNLDEWNATEQELG